MNGEIDREDIIMRKKLYLLYLLIIIIILVNQIISIKYDLNLYEYAKYSRPLSAKEKRWIEDRGTIIYVSDRNAPPLSFIEEENKQYRGLVIDYATALSIELGADIEFRPLIWKEALDSLMIRGADVCDVFPSEEREKDFGFSKPIYKMRGIIVVSSSEKEIEQSEDLEGKRVAIPHGDYASEYLDKNVPRVQYVFTKDIHEALRLLQDGMVEAVAGDEPVISYFSNKMGLRDSTRILDPALYEQDVALAVPKSEEKLLEILNKGILNLKKKDFVIKIQQRWFGISGSIEKNKVTDNLVTGVGVFLIIIFIILFVLYYLNDRLREEVGRRTKELFQSRRELQTTFDALDDFLIVIDMQGRINDCNKSFQNYLIKSKEEVVGTHFVEWEILNYINEKLHILGNGKIQVIKGEKEIRYRERYYTINMFSLKSIEQNPNQILISIKDITDFKFIEKQLLQENKMVAVGQLATGVAHEIRNPLGLIRSYCYILKDSLIEGDNLRPIGIIESSVERIERIINNLLNFSRISGDKWTMVKIKDVISNILELEEKSMKKKDIGIQFICDENLLLYTNEESLKHIIINLIENSTNAIEMGGWIQIICKKVGEGIVLKFEDSGKGIKEEDLEYIFNPFFTTKVSEEGTGLGLYIVYNEVQKLGGNIEVASQYKIGTTFEIFLPERKEGQ